MDKILSINTIKNVFSALGAKTSDDNYGVALLDKTTAEPKGLMGMRDLASLLGGIKVKPDAAPYITDANDLDTGFVFAYCTKGAANAPQYNNENCYILNLRNTYTIQLAFFYGSHKVFMRSRKTSGSQYVWDEWTEV